MLKFGSVLGLLLTGFAALASDAQWQLPQGHQQVVVVTTSGWDDSQGQMQVMTRTDKGWHKTGIASPVTIGKSGMAWGLGLHPRQQGQYKQEGDGRAPAGVFSLTEAFGYEALDNIAMPYQQMNAGHYCMDVKGSPYYNQIVDASNVGEDAVQGSSEGMRRDLHYGDDLYKQGIFVAHNPANISGAGSCIFLHHWRGPGKPTAGCTAMPGEVMTRLLDWLKPEAQPVMVLLPESVYDQKAVSWGLPQRP